MGGRGSASGMSDNGKPYGSEYRSVYAISNIKYLRANDGAAKVPMETMTQGRVYAVVNNTDNVKAVVYFDKHNKRFKQIDVTGQIHFINGVPILPHTHLGYVHDEHGTRDLTAKERKMVDRVLTMWYNRNR